MNRNDLDVIRQGAQEVARAHDPANQPDHNYSRCERCQFTRHPCETHELASIILTLCDVIDGYQ